jgi:hypothetical protein
LRVLHARARTGRSLAELATDTRQLLALPDPAAFESSPEEPAEPLILFQTRLWPESSPEFAAITEERAALLRTLKSAFGFRFVGGAIPDAYARKNYPELLSPHPARMRSWPALVRRCLVTVYSLGLHDSLAFKMSEYLAASRCIVGQPTDLTLPQPLVAGTHFLPFASPGECVAQCDRLLSEPGTALQMRRSNWEYYRAQVQPAAQMQSIIDRSLSPSSGAAASFR